MRFSYFFTSFHILSIHHDSFHRHHPYDLYSSFIQIDFSFLLLCQMEPIHLFFILMQHNSFSIFLKLLFLFDCLLVYYVVVIPFDFGSFFDCYYYVYYHHEHCYRNLLKILRYQIDMLFFIYSQYGPKCKSGQNV